VHHPFDARGWPPQRLARADSRSQFKWAICCFDSSLRVASSRKLRAAFRAVLVWIVGREEYSADANDFNRTLQVGLAEHSTRCDVQILPHVIGYGPWEFCDSIERAQALGIEQNHLSPVPQDDLKLWKAIKYPGENQPQELDPAFVVPSKTERCEC